MVLFSSQNLRLKFLIIRFLTYVLHTASTRIQILHSPPQRQVWISKSVNVFFSFRVRVLVRVGNGGR